MTTLRTIIALFAICLAFSPLADEAEVAERFYLGVGGAQFKSDWHDKDASRAGVMLYGGYRASEYFGAEVGGSLVNGFSATATETEDGETSPPPLTKSEYRNIYVAATGRAPAMKGRIFLNGKLGAHYYKRKDITGGASQKHKSARPLFGAGVELKVGRGGLRADWTKFYGDDNDDMEVIAVNYIYRF